MDENWMKRKFLEWGRSVEPSAMEETDGMFSRCLQV